MDKDFELGCLDVIKAFYSDWLAYCSRGNTCAEHRDARHYEMVDGRNYIKIVSGDNGTQRHVCGFIVKKDTKKFKKGDLLKAASWAAPATNFARGNVFDQESIWKCVRWTSVL